jgi:hypothetical protein
MNERAFFEPPDSDLDLDDDFVFEPSAWDLAMCIRLGVELETDRPALDELADAMLVWADDAESERLTDVAVERLWSDELRDDIRAGLERVAAQGPEWRQSCDEALAALERAPREAPVTRAVVQELAWHLSSLDHPPFFCTCCVEEGLATAPAELRREVARGVAIVAVRNVAFSDEELRAAARLVSADDAVGQLATPARRRAVRERLARIGRLARTSMPDLARELEAIGREPPPERPGDDDVWRELCDFVLDRVRRPELN